MCGIFGSFGRGVVTDKTMQEIADSIAHRGPDASGFFTDDLAALGNVRLSILDLTEASDQPLYSENGDLVVVQNGEIFNFVELRNELKRDGAHFKTTGDTEVLVRAFEFWGPEFVTKLNGMFAIAIYEPREKVLWLYRDRMGVKPLFLCGHPSSRMWFGSEIKAILAAGVPAKPNMDALAQFMALNYIPQPDTAFEGVQHLPPAHMARIDEQSIQLTRYWNLADVTPEQDMSPAEAKAGILQILDDATRIRMRSDAAFGAFLSGGLDSSSVVGMMSLYQSEPVRSFSIGFDDPRFDETRHAKMAAERFGAVHETQVMQHDTIARWPRFIWHVDQPHGDVSFMPTDQVSSLAARDVKMVLTGDGGDELFAGYEKYLKLFPKGRTDHLVEGWEDQFVRDSGLLQGGQPAELLANGLKDAFFDQDPYRALTREICNTPHQDPINRVMYAETTTLLPGNNLVKPDRMAMANSLEVRSPFLDYRMAEHAFRIPGDYKMTNGETKAIYKDAMADLLGHELTYRTKQMFTVPVGEWFRQSLAGYCREVLLNGLFESRGLVDITLVKQMLESHIAGTQNHTRQLRAMISLEIWFRLFIDKNTEWLNAAKDFEGMDNVDKA